MESTVFVTGLVLIVLLMSTESSPASRHTRETDGGLQMPAICSNQTYCTVKHDNYPQEDIDNLLEQHHLYLGNTHAIIDKNNRDGFDLALQKDCEKNFTYDPIFEIKDNQGRVRAVVQSANFMQLIRIEYCLTPDKPPATTRFEEAVAHHEIYCRNEGMSYNFVVLSLDGTTLESVTSMAIPVNCACRYIKVLKKID